jgi:conjugative transfer signal peptidase TraF
MFSKLLCKTRAKKRPLLLILICGAFLALLFFLEIFTHELFLKNYRLTNQNSHSMPEGWYWIVPLSSPIYRNEILVFEPPPHILEFLNTRHWLIPNDWLMKKAMGLPGDFICLKDHQVWINQQPVAPILAVDKNDQALPNLSFCRKLTHNEYFLMSTYITRSFDSRYFGPIDFSLIKGKAIKL